MNCLKYEDGLTCLNLNEMGVYLQRKRTLHPCSNEYFYRVGFCTHILLLFKETSETVSSLNFGLYLKMANVPEGTALEKIRGWISSNPRNASSDTSGGRECLLIKAEVWGEGGLRLGQ